MVATVTATARNTGRWSEPSGWSSDYGPQSMPSQESILLPGFSDIDLASCVYLCKWLSTSPWTDDHVVIGGSQPMRPATWEQLTDYRRVSEVLTVRGSNFDWTGPRSASEAIGTLGPSAGFPVVVYVHSTGGPTALTQEPQDAFGIERRLDEFKDLKDGWADGIQPANDWDNGYGTAPSVEGIDWLKGRFAAYYRRNLPKPHIFPMPEGGVDVEWSVGSRRVSLEIDLETHQAEWHCLDLSAGDSYEQDLELDSRQAWEWLVAELLYLKDAEA